MICEAKSGHPGGSLSAIDLLTALWFSEMRGVDHAPENDPNRDRFVLSKGHAVPALYAILAKKGFIREDELGTLRKTGSRLQGHPDRVRLPSSKRRPVARTRPFDGPRPRSRPPSRRPPVSGVLPDRRRREPGRPDLEAALSAPKFELRNFVRDP